MITLAPSFFACSPHDFWLWARKKLFPEKISVIAALCFLFLTNFFSKQRQPLKVNKLRITSLPDELLVKIAAQLDLQSLNALGATSKRMHAVCQDFSSGRDQEIQRLYPKPFIDALGLKFLTQIPKMQLKDHVIKHEMLSTQNESIEEAACRPYVCGYYNQLKKEFIDDTPKHLHSAPFIFSITADDFKDGAILRGVDPAARPFLAFRYRYQCFLKGDTTPSTGVGVFILHKTHNIKSKDGDAWVLVHNTRICPFTPQFPQIPINDKEHFTERDCMLAPWIYFYTHTGNWDIHMDWLTRFVQGKPCGWLTTKKEFKEIIFPQIQILQGENT